MAEKGWIKLHRDIAESWLWQDEPYDKARAWIDLLLLANYEDKKTAYKGQIVTCKRGDVNLSISYLAKRWGWGREKTTTFLRILESDNMVKINATRNRTTITIVNYGKYQDCPTTDSATNRQPIVQRADNESDITKKEKKDKKVKKYIAATNKFNQFTQNEYDMDALEKELMEN